MENGLDSVAMASRPLDSLLTEIGGTADGLSDAEADARLARFGANDLSAVRRRPLWLQFLDRLHNPLLIILLLASGFSAAAGDLYSFAIVVVIVLLAAVLPLSPLGPLFGFVPLPPAYFAFLAVTVVAYLVLAEGIKSLFYRRFRRQARRGWMGGTTVGRFHRGPPARPDRVAHDA